MTKIIIKTGPIDMVTSEISPIYLLKQERIEEVYFITTMFNGLKNTSILVT